MFVKKSIPFKIITAAIAFFMAAVTFFSCRKDSGTLPTDCVLPQTVFFTSDIIPIFQKNCSTAGCHTGSSPAGNLNLDAPVAYSKLMKSGSGYIDTINPNYSLLYSAMISSSEPMPPTGRLSSCTTSLVLKWIEQKAKNN